MRIISARITAFGHFAERELDLDHRLVTLLGPNEAGKSTLFAFFQSMLYGFYPASRDTHPYAPWNGANAEGAMSVRLQDGRAFTVSRRLMSTPDGKLMAGESVRDLRNQTVQFVDHVDQRVFEAVYALTLQDMAAIEEGAWGEVQDKLLGGLNLDHVLPAREVVARLEEEAKALWKEDRRGKPRARELAERLRELKKDRSDSVDRERLIRSHQDDIERKQQRLGVVRDQLVDLKAQLRRADHVRPVMKRLEQIRSKEAQAGELSELDGLPADLQTWVADRERTIEADSGDLQRLDEEIDVERARYDALTDADRRLVEHEPALRDLLSQRGSHRERLNRRQEKAAEVKSAGKALDEAIEPTLVRWDDAVAERLRELSVAELIQRAHDRNRTEQALRDVVTRIEAERSTRSTPPPILPPAAGLLLGLVLLTAGLLLGQHWMQLVGMAIAVLGGVLLAGAFRARQKPAVDVTLESRRTAAQADRDAAHQAMIELLREIPIPAGRLRDPDQRLAADVEAVRQAVLRVDAEQEALAVIEKQIAADVKEARTTVEAAGLSVDGDLLAMLQHVETVLEPACVRRREAEAASRRLTDLERDRSRLVRSLDEKRAEYQAVRERVESIGDGDFHLGLQFVEDRRRAHQSAVTLQETLEKEHPDWAAIAQEAKSAPEVELSDEAVSRLELERDELQQELTDVEGDLKQHRTEIFHLSEGQTLDGIDSEVAWLENELAEVERSRDRLQLLANLVRRADLRYREQHQPDVLKRARAYLNAFTEGRYATIATDEMDGSLLVLPPGQVTPTDVEAPLSQGTRDQIYLALRLAIADHLDEGRTRLPLFLDETFVNWDAARRRRGIEVLRQMSEHRQIFVFTCHPWLAEELATHADASTISLAATIAR